MGDSTTTVAQRRDAAYGDRTGAGSGYLRFVVSDLPDGRLLPLTWRRTATGLPGTADPVVPGYRDRVDKRVLVGIDLGAAGYRVIHRDGDCFTALEASFLRQVLRDGGAWALYVRRVTDVALD